MTGDLVLTPTGLRYGRRLMPCTIGRGGIVADKREGDGGTPVGRHEIVAMLYRPDRIDRRQLPRWAVPIRPGDLWSDDVADPDYNQLVAAPHDWSHESLRRPDPLYDLVLVTDWNWPDAVPGRGSAIFLHSWRRPGAPTAGCIGLSRHNLLWLARHLTPRTALRVPDQPWGLRAPKRAEPTRT